MGKFQETLGINDFKKKDNNIWKALLAEFIGNVLLNFFGCFSCITPEGPGSDKVLIALTFGFVVFVLVATLAHVSGAHFNPAVTAGMMAVGNINVIKGILYIIVQCLGAIGGSAVLKALTPPIENGTLGATALFDSKIASVEPVQGFGIEFFLGFILVLVVSGVCDPNRPEAKATAALAIGLAVGIGHLAAVGFTGASMNPARTFGSSVIASHWDNHWIYWVGPILGGIAAALLYKNAFAAPSLGPVKIIERYTTVVTDEKELKRLDGGRNEDNLA